MKADYEWRLPPGFPLPAVPADNPMSTAKVALGRYLFYDRRLSFNQTQSCATCHRQELAFSDGRAVAVGSTGESHPRNAMSLTNVAYNPTLTWANPVMQKLERQALVPMFGETPVELGLAGQEQLLLRRLASEPVYQKLFPQAFPGEPQPLNLSSITKALAAFERTLISAQAPYDRYVYGHDETALTPSAKRGERLFFDERLECFDCHSSFNLSGPSVFRGKTQPELEFHNNGLYNLDGKGAYPLDNQGLYVFTNRAEDVGRFRVPTLRNIAVTAPYMHDGSIKSLAEVLDHYAAGGRTIAAGPNAGDGSQSPLKSEFIKGFELTAQEREDLLNFLRALTDEQFLHDPRFSDPWPPTQAGGVSAAGR